MMQALSRATTNFMYWKMVYWKLAVKSIRVGLVTLYTSSNSVNWGSLSSYERFVIVAGSIVAILDVWDSFFDTTLSQLKAGQPPTGNTELIRRQPENG
jgi:hypothetical protein